jgi:hypothetical protein
MRRLNNRGSTLAVWFGIFTLIFPLSFFYRYLQDLAMRQSGTFRVRLIEEFTGCYSAALLCRFAI